ncbi:hypothetical protein BVRB_1g016320 isoform B [Beta vulgaris subsp. vulgaris]|uniref:uncharacterized protein LOC109133518 isoform X2 n=1 Tax=Beta vulgaris subsp. vulgaris TaxID=3555 RepID=UPI00065C4247|nr:uncharacterized protein LOC109133518 isoform X2 [Beta vulgaris subsp. vulgaris]KMT00277.1 hypothetical protein BVRB_1g016320 isoform B [Beta vulgaris subsp. vulgaris]
MTTTSSENHTNNTMNNNGGLAAAKNEFNKDEIEVGNLLLDLPYLTTNSLSSYRFPYHWTTKKLRTALVSPPPPPPPPPSHRKLATPVKTEAATSPNTPLSFSPSLSESDSKFNHSAKRKTPSLNLSLIKVKEYINVLTTENLELLTRKQELLGEKREKIELGCTTQTHRQKLKISVNDRVHAVPSTSMELHHQPPLISPQQRHDDVSDTVYVGLSPKVGVVNDPMCGKTPNTTQVLHSPPLIINQQHGLIINQVDQIHHRNQQGPVMIDLNITPDETKAMAAAAARNNRYRVNKEKRTRVKS